jgi:hypothetical protein
MFEVRNKFLVILCIVYWIASGTGIGSTAIAAAPVESQVQGLYEGVATDAQGETKIEARLVAQGSGSYNVFIRPIDGKGNTNRAELTAKTTDETVTLTGKATGVEWKGVYHDGAIEGSYDANGKFHLERVERKSPTLGKQPPQGAIVLLDGKDFSEMVQPSGAKWDLAKLKPGTDGSIQIPRGGMNSRRAFPGNLDMHVEFQIPFMPTAHGQGRGNSGVFLPNRDEIQVLDSFGEVTYTGGGCGGAYAYKDPDCMEIVEGRKGNSECRFSLASLPPLAWQTYDIEYRVGTNGGKPRVTVYHNGTKIHDNAELHSPSNVGESPIGKLHFQDHGNPVRFRNIWVVSLP